MTEFKSNQLQLRWLEVKKNMRLQVHFYPISLIPLMKSKKVKTNPKISKLICSHYVDVNYDHDTGWKPETFVEKFKTPLDKIKK